MTKAKEKKITYSDRELKALDLLSYGYSNGEIAEKLNISVATATNIVFYLMRKTNAVNRTHLVRYGFEKGLLQ
jgi:DNA-binding NarL/FixJ family response regulator